jgi:hypothetical protein
MEREAPARYASALDLAAALEGFQSASARKTPSKLLSGVLQVSLGAVGLMGVLGVGLALVPVTLAVAASQMLLGAIHTFAAVAAPEMAQNVAGMVQMQAEGLAEASWGPLASVPLALAQAIVWALLARRNVLYEAKRAER